MPGKPAQATGRRKVRSSFESLTDQDTQGQSLQSTKKNKTGQHQTQSSNKLPADDPSSQAKAAAGLKKSKERPVTSVGFELGKRLPGDVAKNLKDFFDLHTLLNIERNSDNPEVKQKKRALHQRWQQLTQAEQKVAQEKYEQRLKEQQAEEKQKQQEKKQQELAQQQAIVPPKGRTDRPGLFIPGKTRKQQTQNRLQQQRRTVDTLSDRS